MVAAPTKANRDDGTRRDSCVFWHSKKRSDRSVSGACRWVTSHLGECFDNKADEAILAFRRKMHAIGFEESGIAACDPWPIDGETALESVDGCLDGSSDRLRPALQLTHCGWSYVWKDPGHAGSLRHHSS